MDMIYEDRLTLEYKKRLQAEQEAEYIRAAEDADTRPA